MLRGSQAHRLLGPQARRLLSSQAPRLTGSQAHRLVSSWAHSLIDSQGPRLLGSEVPKLIGSQAHRLIGSQAHALKKQVKSYIKSIKNRLPKVPSSLLNCCCLSGKRHTSNKLVASNLFDIKCCCMLFFSIKICCQHFLKCCLHSLTSKFVASHSSLLTFFDVSICCCQHLFDIEMCCQHLLLLLVLLSRTETNY